MEVVSVQPHTQIKGIFNHRRIVQVIFKTKYFKQLVNITIYPFTMILLYTFRKRRIPISNIGFLELATPEHLRQSGDTCQCGYVPYITLQTDQKTLHQISQSVSELLNIT